MRSLEIRGVSEQSQRARRADLIRQPLGFGGRHPHPEPRQFEHASLHAPDSALGNFKEAFLMQPIECAIERAGVEADAPLRSLLDPDHHVVAVTRAIGQSKKDLERNGGEREKRVYVRRLHMCIGQLFAQGKYYGRCWPPVNRKILGRLLSLTVPKVLHRVLPMRMHNRESTLFMA